MREKLKLSAIKLSAAENYMGGTVTYLDFNITNTGDKSLVGADVKAQFKDTMGQIVQKETTSVARAGGEPTGRLPRPGRPEPRADWAGPDEDGAYHAGTYLR